MTTITSALCRLSRGLVIAAFAVSAGFVSAQAEPTLNDVYAAAQAGKLNDAQVMMQQVLISHPNSAKAHYVRSEVYARQGDLRQAREELAVADKLAPGLPFAKPESVQALRSELNTSRAAPATAQRAERAGSPAPSSSWATPVLLTAAVLAIGYFMFRRRVPQATQPQPSSRFGYAASQAQPGLPQGAAGAGNWGYGPAGGQPAYGPPTGSGLGGRLAGGLATGLAVGAGVMAAEAIGRNLSGSHGRDHLTMDSFANEPDADALRRNADMGGQDFGVNDAASWDDGGFGAGSSSDWDT